MSWLLDALRMAADMFWEILWALGLGFLISAVVQAVVSKGEMKRLLPDSSAGSLVRALGLGAASSSCSYAAVAIAKSLIQKGADFTASIAFEFASTNLVIELCALIFTLLGWRFMAGEVFGGVLLVFILALLFRLFLRPAMLSSALEQLKLGLAGRMEGHAAMDMSVDPSRGNILQRLFTSDGLTATSHYFFMDLASVWKDILGGLLIAGALAAWVPESGWQHLFLKGQPPVVQSLWGACIGPVVSMLSCVCSVGNIPMAAVLWKGGISFGGVMSFIFADLIIPPVLNIYRKYYGTRMMLFLWVTSYVAMVLAGLAVQAAFGAFHLLPSDREGILVQAPHLDYTAALNALLLLVAGWLLIRFLRTGGPEMLREMETSDPWTP